MKIAYKRKWLIFIYFERKKQKNKKTKHAKGIPDDFEILNISRVEHRKLLQITLLF